MARHIVFLLHGMGRQLAAATGREAGWHEPIIDALDEGWRSLPTLRTRERARYIELVPIHYDQVFRDYLADVGEGAQAVRAVLPAGELDDFFAELGTAADQEPDFLWDNVMDVLLYRYGGDLWTKVHAVVAKQIVDTVVGAWDRRGDYGTSFSMITHSLGTAVAHGALNRLGGGNVGSSAAFRLGSDFHLRAYVTLANVSRMLWWGEQDLYAGTVVRPTLRDGSLGYVDTFLNVRHANDPIAAARRFAPTGWRPGYREIVVRHLREPNPHAFTHYLRHPLVYGAVLRSILGAAYVPEVELDALVDAYPDVSIRDPAKRLRVEALLAAAAQEIHTAFADEGVLWPVSRLMARAVRLAWQHRKALRPLVESVG